MIPKKVRNVKRAEWKRDDPVEYGKQEPRRQFWLDAKAARTVARMMAVRGRVSDNSQNLDVLTCAGRSQHASLRLEGISMSSPRLAQGRFGDTRATQTAPSKMEVQSRHATAAVASRVKHSTVGLMTLDDGNDAAAKSFFGAGGAPKKLMSGEFRSCICVLDLLYSGDRSLWHGVPKERLIVSVPYEEGPPCAKNLSRELHRVLKVCSKLRTAVHVRVSASEGVDHRSPRCASAVVNQPDAGSPC